MKIKTHRLAKIMLCTSMVVMLILGGCSSSESKKAGLDPKNPITISLWHYQDSAAKVSLDSQIATFNETIGKEEGIIVEAKSYGKSEKLKEVVIDAAKKKIGSDPLPNIFTAYPDNAYLIDQLVGLVDLEEYFSKEELEQYNMTFLENDRIGKGNKLKLIPVSKSTEAIFINQNEWDAFANATNTNEEKLATWEGIKEVAKRYYEWTDEKTAELNDGKAFWGMDSMYHFMLMLTKSAGGTMYKTDDQKKTTFIYSEEDAKRVWEIYYEGYLSGWYKKENSYTSADVSAGTIIASVMSSAGGNYFPTKMTVDKDTSTKVTCKVLPYPSLTGGKLYAPIRGMDMSISKSDKAHEYASALFLKWFTKPEQNSIFTASIGFLPVQKEALSGEAIKKARETVKKDSPNPAITEALQTAQHMLSTYTMYNSKPFAGEYDVKGLLESSLPELAQQDLKQVEMRVQNGENRKAVIAEYNSEEHFKQWYNKLVKDVNAIIEKNNEENSEN
ncbi:MAG: extracellular solute-binding protein [Anaerovoracaceae bacterium]